MGLLLIGTGLPCVAGWVKTTRKGRVANTSETGIGNDDAYNCLACHVIAGGTQMGDIGPPLAGIGARFPDRKRLRDQIWDAGQFNDASLMPPFGRHEILSGREIDAIVEFLYTL